jgi:hypothetical protein
MRLLRGGRPLKRWRYVGAYGPDFMVCAASVRIGVAGQSWIGVWDRQGKRLVETFSHRADRVDVATGRVRGRGDRLVLDLHTDEATTTADPVAVTSLHGAQHIWTRKLPVRVHGSVIVDGVPRAFAAAGLIDDSAGYHARRTDWEWSAGVGTLADGRAVVWNLVDGVHDAPVSSERTVWVDGRAHEVGPVRFRPRLAGVDFAEGGPGLTCAIEAERARHENLLIARSDYRQPFGTFAGELPGAGALVEAYGVMEEHSVRW